jgi:pyridoxine 5-phosphate synthase
LREDRRHIQDRDVWRLRRELKTRLNLEMANSEEIIRIALEIKPDIVCIVPEKRQEVTTEGGLDVASQADAIAETCKRMNDSGIQVSLFVNPDIQQIEAAARARAQFVELHTGAFAETFDDPGARERERVRLVTGAEAAYRLGVRVNAGHGLNYRNLPVLQSVPHLEELNIGHSIVSRAMFVGMAVATREMLTLMEGYKHDPGSRH